MSNDLINVFSKQVECEYRNEHYSVRDNGSIMRHPPIGKKPRKLDNTWTFGKYSDKTGYAEIAGQRVHRIVATAFHGAAPSSQHVVDHIDTNRRNNRPENLRWVTKLENALMNPITAKKIEHLCGSIEEFLKDPSKLRSASTEPNFEWMRAVSEEEASACLERMTNWANDKKTESRTGSIGDWIFRRTYEKPARIEEQENVTRETDPEKEKATNNQMSEKSTPKKVSKSNPFDFPRPDKSDTITSLKMYKSKSEIFSLLKKYLDSEKNLLLPKVALPTAGNSILIKESCNAKFEKIDYNYEKGKHNPQYIILHIQEESIVLIIRTKSKEEIDLNKLKSICCNIVEIDFSWATNGVTEDEMKYILQEDTTKKKWIFHQQIIDSREKLLNVCETVESSGNGVLHSYIACPLVSNSVQDMDCWYCDYHITETNASSEENDIIDYCFGKSGVKTYEDLLSIVDVTKENDRIVNISYNKNGETVNKSFEAHVKLPGKTILELWNENSLDKMIVHNIYSDWYVMLDENPNVSAKANGAVYGKLARSIEGLNNANIRSIYSFDDCCWEIIK